ncbi:MAG: SpoIIE family protein phosphatase [Bacteroidales bacterium]|nr:SpoIIE family protein phosphatase [Bacteroidales bacterium]
MSKIQHTIHPIITFFLAILSLGAFSQPGTVYLSHYFPQYETYTANLNMIYGPNGHLIMANEKGILIFDGYQWELITTPDIPTTLFALPSIAKVAVGGKNLVGFVEEQPNGDFSFTPLKHDSIGIVLQIESIDSLVYFLTSQQIIVWNFYSGLKSIINARNGKSFQILLPFSDKIYVDDGSSKLQLIKGNHLKPAGPFPLSGKVLFARQFDKKRLLLVTINNQNFLYDEKQITPFNIEDQQYLNQGSVNQILVDDKLIVYATNHGGALVINKYNGKTLHYINYQTGLPDDEIYCTTLDSNGGIWLGHYYGISRADLQLPIRNFSTYPGLQGRPQCVALYNTSLYVGTNEGVFRLVKKASYQAVALPTKAKAEEKIEIQSEVKVEEPKVTSEPPAKKGLFARIFGKKKKKEEEIEIKPIVAEKQVPSTETRKPTKPEIQYRLASVSYQYEKIAGITKKCRNLLIFNNSLIAITTDEMFLIDGNKAKSIARDIQVSVACKDSVSQQLYLGTMQGIKVLNKNLKLVDFIPEFKEPVNSMSLVKKTLWLVSENKVLKINTASSPYRLTYLSLKEKNEKFIIKNIQNVPYVIAGSNFYRIHNDSLQYSPALSSHFKGVNKYITHQYNKLWANVGNSWKAISPTDSTKVDTYEWLNLFDNISYISQFDSVIWVIENNQNIYRISEKLLQQMQPHFKVYIKKLIGNNGQLFPLEKIELNPSENFLKLVVFAPHYVKSSTTLYAFYIENLMQQWSNWSPSPEFNMTLPPGKWQVHVKAKNVFGKESEEKIIQIVIKKPFFQQWWFYLIIVAVIALIVGSIVTLRIRYLEREKAILEAKVKERTREIEEQKEEILSQRDALAMQNILITEQKSRIELINKEITDSIRYAQHIQSSLLPNEAELNKIFDNYFVLYKPKDIVSGDFYWARRKGNKIFFAAADCTGHGVPGGFLTMLGISFLNEIFLNDRVVAAHEVLNMLRAKIVGSLLRENQAQQAQDGMDIAFCVIDMESCKIQFAAANSQAYLVKESEIFELKGDKMPIGLHVKDNESFSSTEVEYSTGDELFLFSDGYKDQIGGENEKRLKSAAFKKILFEVYPYPVDIQKQKLEQYLEEWKGLYDQTDDILVIGIRL